MAGLGNIKAVLADLRSITGFAVYFPCAGLFFGNQSAAACYGKE